MTTRYCGPGGNDSNSGLSYALRKLTLSGLEATPVVAGDICWIAPGVYRELLAVGVSGSAGSPIEYRADVTGENTDGVGGIVRITGSVADQATSRASGITATSKDYRTFRGFALDTFTSDAILVTTGSNWIVEDCTVQGCVGDGGIKFSGTGTTNTVRRCVVFANKSTLNGGIWFTHSATVSAAAHVIENCLVFACNRTPAYATQRVGGITITNCIAVGCETGVTIITALAVGQTVTVNNCIFTACGTGLVGTVSGEIVENYNTFFGNGTDRTNTGTGANSISYPALFNPLSLLSTFLMPQYPPFSLSQWSQVRRIAGTAMSTDDLFGITRPVTDSKKSWGPIQYHDRDRETTTKRTGAASIKLADAGRVQMFVPTSNVSTVFSVYVQYEANYAGTLPSMIIRQPGQSPTTVTAVGASGSWELLTTTLTPAASPGYVVIDLRSSNTASGASISVFFDDLVIS